MRILLGLTLITACNGAPLRAPGQGQGRPPSGVYQASEVITGNDCRPSPVALEGSEALTFADDHIFAPLPIGTIGLEGFHVPWDGLAVELDFCRAHRSFLIEVTHFDDRDLDLRRTTMWTETAAATPACGAPVSDCSSVEDFHFSLLEACEHACFVKGMLHEATCSCP